MDELMDLLVKDESPTQISDTIKDILYARTAEKVNAVTPGIMTSVFDGDQPEASAEVEVEQELDVEETPEEEQI
tara:strand:+ start:827 stop:1048 length:222 start_codon:yes stop_codon:yes gene_type:complete